MSSIYKTFDDFLIKPKFSNVSSRKDVDISVKLSENLTLDVPVFSANMATVTEALMANKMRKLGGVGVLHRFSKINENVNMFLDSHKNTFCSIGISDDEKIRAGHLAEAGCSNFCIDVAHGAQTKVIEQYKWLRNLLGKNSTIIVGNFATPESIAIFKDRCSNVKTPDLFKIGIGPGSVCETRVKTGVGVPQLDAVRLCAKEASVIADGGMKTPGDICKALAAGAKAVMLGGMLAKTKETPKGDFYHGSAFLETPSYKTSEGAKLQVEKTQSVDSVMKDIAGGIRSALTYVGAKNLREFVELTEFIEVSSIVTRENKAHFSS